MKAIVCLLAMSFVLACCKSKEKLITTGDLTEQQVDIVVKEDINDTLTVSLQPEVVPHETVSLTHGNAMARYCVIVGSFMYEQNARKLRENLLGMGFSDACIMQNQQRMYRVAAVCYDEKAEAQKNLWSIRRQYPQFIDAWLLQVKN